MLAVPILRGGEVLGVLVVQNRTPKEYSDEDVEVLQTTAMVVAEHLVSGAVAGRRHGDRDSAVAVRTSIEGEPLSEGIALGHVVLHEPRIVVTELDGRGPGESSSAGSTRPSTSCGLRIDEMLEHERAWPAPASIARCSRPTACLRTTRVGCGACARRSRAA